MSESDTPADKVDQIRTRPPARLMSLHCIFDEVEELTSSLEDAEFEERDAIMSRFRNLSRGLEQRLDVEYPRCPECAGKVARTEKGDVICFDRHHELPDEVIDEYERVDGRLWGKRGHNGGAR